MAENLRDIFTEVIVAPDFEPEALRSSRAKKNLRLLQLPADWEQETMDVRLVSGGLLLQDADRFPSDIDAVAKDWELVSGERPADEEMTNLIFAWKACRAVKSNAIVLAQELGDRRDRHGAGQPRGLLPPRGRAGRATARPARSRHPTPSSRSPTGRQVLIDGGHPRDRAARRIGARRRGHRGGPGEPA